nr:copia protein [Tanacetum cinerariifolium]
MIRNKARLVAQGHTQEEGIDYDEFFVLVLRIKAIRLFLAYASFEDFVVYQMNLKSAFLYRKIKEEVYVCQPPGFKDPNFPDRVYKVEKALYGLHQAPRAWKELCITFEKLINEKFQMSSMGELAFFLGLQVKQKNDGIFISQDKYVGEILNNLGLQKSRMQAHQWKLKSLCSRMNMVKKGYKYHPLHVITYPLDQIRTDLSYEEEPEAIIARQDRIMRKKTILFVKILWRNHPEREATWEIEESIRTTYPHFLP